jgi:diguanylate cyclase (GGDEF)-like protein
LVITTVPITTALDVLASEQRANGDLGLSPPCQGLSVRKIWRYGSRREQCVVAGLWLLSLAASVGLGLASVIWDWSGIPFGFGGVQVYVTIYPPLIICLLWTLCCGFWWGAIPAYLSTLALALYAGMPPLWALLFAFSDPLGFAIMSLGYQAINIRRDLRDFSALLFFVQLSFVASIYSSSGALVWCYTNRIDATALLAIWQGWWLGAFLQNVLIIGPAMTLFWPWMERWQGRRSTLLGRITLQSRGAVLGLLGSAGFGVLIYGFVTLQLAGTQVDLLSGTGNEKFLQAIAVMRQTTWVFYWVFALIVLFMAFFGYQIFIHWQHSTDLLLAKLHKANTNLQQLALTDALTGLYNRRAAEDRVRSEWNRLHRLGQNSAVVMLDIDHFKQINDRYGHAVGDGVIRSLAAAIRLCIRDIDIAGRYGGEEFLIILPQADANGAWVFAERLREHAAAAAVSCEGGPVTFSISLGIAQFDPADKTFEDWLERADKALYHAKRSGRNLTMIAG